jgi:hypothetical protein
VMMHRLGQLEQRRLGHAGGAGGEEAIFHQHDSILLLLNRSC